MFSFNRNWDCENNPFLNFLNELIVLEEYKEVEKFYNQFDQKLYDKLKQPEFKEGINKMIEFQSEQFSKMEKKIQSGFFKNFDDLKDISLFRSFSEKINNPRVKRLMNDFYEGIDQISQNLNENELNLKNYFQSSIYFESIY